MEISRLAKPSNIKTIVLSVNQKDYKLRLSSRTTLAEALRNYLGLVGTKLGCNRAMCGSCTVQVDKKPIFACTMLAVEAAGKSIETIEGLEKSGRLHPVQEAFIECDAVQCGICIPGMVMSVKALLDENLNPTEEDVKVAVEGNLCRCGTYPNTIKAGMLAASRIREARVGSR